VTPQDFIAKWDGADGSERANYQLFFNDLCDLLGVEKPQPAQSDDWLNAYVYERYIDARNGESAGISRFIDTYRRARFICESKSFALGKNAESGDRKLFKAKSQAESYARNLPESEPRPPILMVVNVGRFIALYAQFKDNDRAYEMFPDRASYKISIADLARDDIRERLREVWLAPHALNPELVSARVTRAVAMHLGTLARELEQSGHDSHLVAGFLTRCLFTLFAEDVGLLPAGAFIGLLTRALASPAALQPNLEDLWRAMDGGNYAVSLQAEVAHFNGKLFKTPDALPLNRAQIETLLAAAKQDWKHVEPAIFGTLIERALDPDERHALGAHFTARAYVERLVLPTVIDPLSARWANVQAAAISLEDDGDHKGAVKLVRDFHGTLCQTRVLDPACGSGNFLYVALEHMKRLEGEVLEQLGTLQSADLGDKRGMQQQEMEAEGLSVDPHQFLGLERNPRPAAWPRAEFVVGNPPFIGAASMRQALGDGYVEALRAAYPAVPESADLVMFWWHCAAQLLAGSEIERFGFITTNSLTQTFNRRVLEAHLLPSPASGTSVPRRGRGAGGEGAPIHIDFVIPDHPWVDSADGADVRVAMTVAAPGDGSGRLLHAVRETLGKRARSASRSRRKPAVSTPTCKLARTSPASRRCGRTKVLQTVVFACSVPVSSSPRNKPLFYSPPPQAGEGLGERGL
jgi:hypothetical protein